MRNTLTSLFLICFAFAPLPTNAQQCGDVNNSGIQPNISDWVYLMTFMGRTSGTAPLMQNWSIGDVDHREDLTVADLVMFGNYMWLGTPGTLTCNITGNYSFGVSGADTIFIPRILSLPDGIDSVRLPVRSNFQPHIQGVYVPMLKAGVPDNGIFRYEGAAPADIYGNFYYDGNHQCLTCDTIVLIVQGFFSETSVDDSTNVMAGAKTLAYLRYKRISAGDGAVAPVAVNRNELWKPSIEINSDLLTPVIQYYDFQFPPETLKVSPGSLDFNAIAGLPVADSFVVNFTSSGLPISFGLIASEPWVTIVDTGAPGFRTPCSVPVKVNPETVGIGSHSAQVDFTSLTPAAPVSIPHIGVSLNVRAPNIWPLGDLDCDGLIDISDLSAMIDHLYISLTPLVPCQP